MNGKRILIGSNKQVYWTDDHFYNVYDLKGLRAR